MRQHKPEDLQIRVDQRFNTYTDSWKYSALYFIEEEKKTLFGGIRKISHTVCDHDEHTSMSYWADSEEEAIDRLENHYQKLLKSEHGSRVTIYNRDDIIK